jgi:predicted dehydrogenase
MTPDHLHATVAIAAMRKGKHVLLAKPIGNRLMEARLVIEAARKTKVGTHFMPANDGAQVQTALDWIKDGAIGTLREIHNWSARPMWPHYPVIPADRPPIPKDFDWTMWLGPSLDRPYHPNYTHTNFRGWYEFGGGPLADMGHYSLWSIFRFLDLDSPYCVETTPTHLCAVSDGVASKIKNDYSFPVASTIRMRFAAKGARPAMDIIWYDGGIRPQVPEEVSVDNKELESEGMLYVGDKGKILAGFRGESPRIIPEAKMAAYRTAKNLPAPVEQRRGAGAAGQPRREAPWIATFKGGPPTYGDFLFGLPISDAFNLASISMRLGGKKLLWDAQSARVTNVPEANKYLVREYRPGWELL